MWYLQFSAKTRLLVATKWSLWRDCIITVNPKKFNAYVYHWNVRFGASASDPSVSESVLCPGTQELLSLWLSCRCFRAFIYTEVIL
jgi:hypothetical protein